MNAWVLVTSASQSVDIVQWLQVSLVYRKYEGLLKIKGLSEEVGGGLVLSVVLLVG